MLVETLPHTRSVSIGCFVRVGSAHELPSQAGISHFLEHMLFKGSQRFPSPKQISDAIEGVGGIHDAYTDHESTVFHAKVADLHAQRAMDVLGDMLCNPLLLPEDVEKERRVIIEELRQTADTPAEYVHSILDAAMWGDQPLGRDIAGSTASVADLRHTDLTNFWRQHYTGTNTIVSLAGNITPDQAAEIVERTLGNLPSGVRSTPIVTTPAHPGPQLTLERDPSEQASFAIGLPGLSRYDPDRRALMVLDTILGGSMSSRLIQSLREERGLAYHLGSESHDHHDAGKWIIFASVEPDRLNEALQATFAELHKLRQQGISPAELDGVKQQVQGGILLSLEDTWAVAARNGSHQLFYGEVLPIEQVVAEVDAVTIEAIERVIERLLHKDALHLAIIGPYDKRSERALAKQLQQWQL
ncbi:MAG: pitrilysin family protein [Roseiflexaceae bacterium]